MPRQQVMIERANAYFQHEKLIDPGLKPDPNKFPEGSSLGVVLSQVGIARPQPEKDIDVANSMPKCLAEALKATVRNNLSRPAPYSMQFLWWPGPEWELSICEMDPVPNVPGSIGGISIVIRSKPDPLELQPKP
jgi:hypothetical protein